MNKFLIIFAALWACAWAYNRYEPSYVRFESSDEDEAEIQQVNDSKANPYSFEYEVNDGYSNNFGHRQKSDGKVTSGSYRVELPDGRTQIVTYRADENGYNAKVTYEKTKYTAPLPAPSYYNPPAAYNVYTTLKPLSYRTTTPAPLKPLIFRNSNSPFYEFPSIAPYGAYVQDSSTPSSKGESEDSDEESADDARLPLAPLAFRNKEEQVDRPYVYRSGYGKRSPIDVWSEADIIQALNTPAIVKEVITNEETTLQVLPDDEVPSTPSEVSDVESITDPTQEYVTSAYEQVELDHLPFPLPVPLAFRSDAI